MKKRTILLAFIISAVAMTSGCSVNEPKKDEVKKPVPDSLPPRANPRKH